MWPESLAAAKKPHSDKRTYWAGSYSLTNCPNRRQQSKRRWATGRAGRLLFIVLGGLPQFCVAREVMLDPQLRVRLPDVVVDHCAAGDGLLLVELERGHPSQLALLRIMIEVASQHDVAGLGEFQDQRLVAGRVARGAFKDLPSVAKDVVFVGSDDCGLGVLKFAVVLGVEAKNARWWLVGEHRVAVHLPHQPGRAGELV